jgi:predicted dinucleotide-binding enzyme
VGRDDDVGCAEERMAVRERLRVGDVEAGVRLVRAFNTVGSGALRSESHRAGDKVAVPLAADDEAALKIAIQLVQDAGFEPVVVGPLARAKEFDTGTPVYGKALTAAELRRGLGMGS